MVVSTSSARKGVPVLAVNRRRRSAAALLAASAVAVLLTGCDADAAHSDGRLHVVATTPVLADFARQIGGDRVDVYDMIKPNVDPHDFESSPADLVALAEAKVVVRNGAGLEPWLDDAIDSSDFGGTVVDTSSRVPLRRTDGSEIPPGQLTADDARSGAVDPHIWQDPRNAELMVAAMRDAFVAADPRDAGVFRSDTVRYLAVLAALDARVARSIATLPATNRTVVTNHDAFDYYLRRYGLTFVGSIIPSFDTSAELSGKSLDDLVARIRAQHVRAVFSETSLPPRTAQTVAREAGVRVVAGAGSLYGDTLGLPGSPGDTYVHMIDHNTTTFVTALR